MVAWRGQRRGERRGHRRLEPRDPHEWSDIRRRGGGTELRLRRRERLRRHPPFGRHLLWEQRSVHHRGMVQAGVGDPIVFHPEECRLWSALAGHNVAASLLQWYGSLLHP